MRITFTQEDVDLAKELIFGHGQLMILNCPITQAVKRKIPGATINTSTKDVRIEAFEGPIWYDLSMAAKHFVRAFDSGLTLPPLPVTFDLNPR